MRLAGDGQKERDSRRKQAGEWTSEGNGQENGQTTSKRKYTANMGSMKEQKEETAKIQKTSDGQAKMGDRIDSELSQQGGY